MSDSDRLARFRKGDAAPEIKPSGEKTPYQAFQPGKENQRYLELRLKYPEPAECPLNAMISLIRAEWRWGLGITLIYGNQMVVTIKGKNLAPLAEALKEWKVVWLAEFDPENHIPATDDNAPFIKSIEVVPTRPEAPPPMSERH
jgi:hypothetical protein